MEETTTTTTPKSLDEHMREFEQWLKARNLQPIVVALGKRSGSISPIVDFMPDTHQATFILQPVQR